MTTTRILALGLASSLLVLVPASAQGVPTPETEPESSESSRGWFDPASATSPAAMQEEAPELPDATRPWRFQFNSHWWLPLKIKGPVSVGSAKIDLDIDLRTLLEDLKFIVEGGLELTNDEWSFLVSGLYLNIGTDATTTVPSFGTRETDIGFKATIVDMAGAYRLGDWSLGDSGNATCAFDLTAGIMVWDLDIEVDTIGPFGFDLDINADENWVDLMVGGRLLFDLSDQVNLSLRGEVGGFGIGSGSDLSWNVTLLGEFKLSEKIDFVAGFRYLSFDLEKNSGADRIGYDWDIYGPIVGVTIKF